MKRERVFFTIFMIFLGICITLACYVMLSDIIKRDAWETKTVEGHISQLILFNDFPQLQTYVGFTSGDYLVVTHNYFWAYSHLSQIGEENDVNITYQQNALYHKRIIKIEEIEV